MGKQGQREEAGETGEGGVRFLLYLQIPQEGLPAEWSTRYNTGYMATTAALLLTRLT